MAGPLIRMSVGESYRKYSSDTLIAAKGFGYRISSC